MVALVNNVLMVTMITTDVLVNSFTTEKGTCEDSRVKAIGVVEVEVHSFLNSVPGGGEWLASRPGCFTPRERAPATH